jgi:hypothetical protein
LFPFTADQRYATGIHLRPQPTHPTSPQIEDEISACTSEFLAFQPGAALQGVAMRSSWYFRIVAVESLQSSARIKTGSRSRVMSQSNLFAHSYPKVVQNNLGPP